jgi:predicted transcriptional regulator of viral defense system
VGRTYTQFIDDRGRTEAPWLKLVMMAFMVDGPSLTVVEVAEVMSIELEHSQSIAHAMYRAKNRGWLDRVKRGHYRLTPEGRKMWYRILDIDLMLGKAQKEARALARRAA